MDNEIELKKQQQGLRLKEVRDACGKKIIEMAHVLGFRHASSYHILEKGENTIRSSVLHMLKIALNVNGKYVMDGEGDMFLSKESN